jgi:hypothetical protein
MIYLRGSPSVGQESAVSASTIAFEKCKFWDLLTPETRGEESSLFYQALSKSLKYDSLRTTGF